MDEIDILDGVRMAHDFRGLLWDTWGERSVPLMRLENGECQLNVRGTDGDYVVKIEKVEA